jgi:hypothetical protein
MIPCHDLLMACTHNVVRLILKKLPEGPPSIRQALLVSKILQKKRCTLQNQEALYIMIT